MEKITYILGAGFSAATGMPVMRNFITKAKDLYYSEPLKYKQFGEVFKKIDELSKIKNYFNADLFNIEELLSIWDMESSLTQLRNKSTFEKFIIDVVNSYSFSEDEIGHQFPLNWQDFIFGTNESYRVIVSFVANIFHLVFSSEPASTRETSFIARIANSDTKYAVVSLNYDSLLETSIRSISNKYNANIEFEKEKYLDTWETPMLFKLHGDVEKNKIIAPTWAKSIGNDMKGIWKNAYESIKDSTQIRIMGYSLPISDSYFQYF